MGEGTMLFAASKVHAGMALLSCMFEQKKLISGQKNCAGTLRKESKIGGKGKGRKTIRNTKRC